MRLHYFSNAEYGLLTIRRRRLKLARINELNDPFEFWASQRRAPICVDEANRETVALRDDDEAIEY